MIPPRDVYPSLAAVREAHGVKSQQYHDAFMAAAHTEQGTEMRDSRTVFADKRTCFNCGSLFRPTFYQIRIGGGWCCSPRCYDIIRRMRQRMGVE